MKKFCLGIAAFFILFSVFLMVRYKVPPRFFEKKSQETAAIPTWLKKKQACSFELSSFDFHYREEHNNTPPPPNTPNLLQSSEIPTSQIKTAVDGFAVLR